MFIGLLVVIAFAKAEDICRALVLQGGGSLGAYQAGLLKGFLHNADPADFEWNIITGVSAGALNAVGCGLWERGHELETSDFWV